MKTLSHIVAVAFGLTFLLIGNHWRTEEPASMLELDFDIPVPHQLAASFGDRFLAANVATWRAVVVRTNLMNAAMMKTLAKLQLAASWLNPAHEDNYYTATAILPWSGYLNETQIILARASKVRSDDIWPDFFLGFNRMYFLADYRGAAEAAMEAASKSRNNGEQNALALMASRWLERQGDIAFSTALLRGMAERAIDPALKAKLMSQVERMDEFGRLRDVLGEFAKARGRRPMSIRELTDWATQTGHLLLPITQTYSLRDGELVIGSLTTLPTPAYK